MIVILILSPIIALLTTPCLSFHNSVLLTLKKTELSFSSNFLGHFFIHLCHLFPKFYIFHSILFPWNIWMTSHLLKVVFPQNTFNRSRQFHSILLALSKIFFPRYLININKWYMNCKRRFLHSLCPPSCLLAATLPQICCLAYVIYSFNGTTFPRYFLVRTRYHLWSYSFLTTTWDLASKEQKLCPFYISLLFSILFSIMHIEDFLVDICWTNIRWNR